MTSSLRSRITSSRTTRALLGVPSRLNVPRNMLAEHAQPYRFNSEGQGIETLHLDVGSVSCRRRAAVDRNRHDEISEPGITTSWSRCTDRGSCYRRIGLHQERRGLRSGVGLGVRAPVQESLVGAVASASYLESWRHTRAQYMGWSSVQTDETRFGHRRIVERRGHSDRSARPFHTDAVV
jgi:hypothetical protein